RSSDEHDVRVADRWYRQHQRHQLCRTAGKPGRRWHRRVFAGLATSNGVQPEDSLLGVLKPETLTPAPPRAGVFFCLQHGLTCSFKNAPASRSDVRVACTMPACLSVRRETPTPVSADEPRLLKRRLKKPAFSRRWARS